MQTVERGPSRGAVPPWRARCEPYRDPADVIFGTVASIGRAVEAPPRSALAVPHDESAPFHGVSRRRMPGNVCMGLANSVALARSGVVAFVTIVSPMRFVCFPEPGGPHIARGPEPPTFSQIATGWVFLQTHARGANMIAFWQPTVVVNRSRNAQRSVRRRYAPARRRKVRRNDRRSRRQARAFGRSGRRAAKKPGSQVRRRMNCHVD